MRRLIPSIMALQSFESAARNQSFSQAARELALGQGAISRQIRILEGFLGQELFVRVKQRVVLTKAGELYLDEISSPIQSLEASTIKLKSFQEVAGSINVGCYPTLATRWLLPYTLRFADENLELSVNSITYQDNNHLGNINIDIGVIHGDPPFRGFHAEWLMAEELVVVASPSLILSPVDNFEELLNYRRISHVSRPESWRIWFETQNRQDIQPNGGGLSFPQFDMVIEAVIAGYGVGVLPLILVEKELSLKQLAIVHAHKARTVSAYYLITPLNKMAIPKINLFRTWLTDRMQTDTNFSVDPARS